MANFKNIGTEENFQVYLSVKTGRVQMNDGNESVTLGLNDSKEFMNRYQEFLYNGGYNRFEFFADMWIKFKNGLD